MAEKFTNEPAIAQEIEALEQAARDVQKLQSAYNATGLPAVPFDGIFSAALNGNTDSLAELARLALAEKMSPGAGKTFVKFLEIKLPDDWQEVSRVAAFLSRSYRSRLQRAVGTLERVDNSVKVKETALEAIRQAHTHILTDSQKRVAHLVQVLGETLQELATFREIERRPFREDWLDSISYTDASNTLNVEPDIAQIVRLIA